MALKNTVDELRELLFQITRDLEKGERGNKTAAQRVRTGTVRLEKVAKVYRKESIKSEKTSGGKKTKAAKKTTAPKSSKTEKKSPVKKAEGTKKTVAFGRRATAKIPQKRARA